jgi:predicted RNA-binding protein with PIN domain
VHRALRAHPLEQLVRRTILPALAIADQDVYEVPVLPLHVHRAYPLREGHASTFPGVRYLVDGMNVIGTRPDNWWKDRHAAMVRLVDTLERWVAAGGDDVTVVFEQPPRPPIRSTVIEVAHAPRPRRDSADDEIARRLEADDDPGKIRVVTSDRWLADRARLAGATVEPAESFRRRIEGD